ncbi:MAG: oligosaccharide flippase family protein [Thermoplasmata archaeon]|nr:oligosaccharide flippase family protein [Thermoplasmata archaeon]
MGSKSAVPPSDGDLREFLAVGRGTSVLIVGTLVLFGASFLSRVLIVRGYSLAVWGDFNLGIALTGLLSLLALLGLDQAAARSLSFERDPAIRRSIVRSTVAVATASGVIASVATYVLAGPIAQLFHDPGLAGIFQIFSVTVGFGVMSLMLAALFQGFEDAAPNAAFNQILNPVLFVGAVALAVGFHWGFTWVVVGYAVAEGVALAALSAYALVRLPERIPRAATGNPHRPRIWPLAVSFWGVGSLAFITAFADTLILGAYRPAADVGFYSAAMTLARVLLVANGALTYIYLPVAARLARSGNLEMLRATYLTGTRWSLLLVTPGFLVFTLLPGPSLTAVFGPAYGGSTGALQILGVAAFASVVVGPANACQAGLGEVRTLLGATAAASAANVALSFTLIPLLGVLGAAIAWGVARGMYPGLGLIVLHRRYGVMPFQRTLLRPLAFTLGVCTPVFLAIGRMNPPPWAVFPAAAFGCAVAVLALVVTRSVVPGDLAFARGVEALAGRPLPALHRLLRGGIRVTPAGGATP